METSPAKEIEKEQLGGGEKTGRRCVPEAKGGKCTKKERQVNLLMVLRIKEKDRRFHIGGVW